MSHKEIKKNLFENKIKPMQKINFFYSNKDDIPIHLKEFFKEGTVTDKTILLNAIEYIIDKLPADLNCFISMEFYSKRKDKVARCEKTNGR